MGLKLEHSRKKAKSIWMVLRCGFVKGRENKMDRKNEKRKYTENNVREKSLMKMFKKRK